MFVPIIKQLLGTQSDFKAERSPEAADSSEGGLGGGEEGKAELSPEAADSGESDLDDDEEDESDLDDDIEVVAAETVIILPENATPDDDKDGGDDKGTKTKVKNLVAKFGRAVC